MHTQNEASQRAMTPQQALQLLLDGNGRFRQRNMLARDLVHQMQQVRQGQWPFAVILSCMDSRTAPELIFDLGLGDAFCIRLAGNVLNEDVLGSLEFACKVAGAKLILVLGHRHCGAVQGACDGVELGNLSQLLQRLQLAIEVTPKPVQSEMRTAANPEFVEAVTRNHVLLTLLRIREASDVLREMADLGDIGIAGGIYDLDSGLVEILPTDDTGWPAAVD
jgi:carbonic anhydrase